MDALSADDRAVLTLLSEGVSDLEICRQLRLSAQGLARAIHRIEERAVQESNDAGRYYERALRIRSENALKSLDARFHALMSILPDAVMVVDGRTGIIKEVNDLACQLFGYERQKLIGMSVEELVPAEQRVIHPAYRLGFLASVRKRELGYHPPIFGVRSDGTKIEVAIALTATSADDDVMVVCTSTSRSKALPDDGESLRRPQSLNCPPR